MSTHEETARTLLAGALNMPAEEVDGATALGVTAQWDSLAHMRLVFGLEERLGRQLEPREIVSLTALENVVAMLAGTGGEPAA